MRVAAVGPADQERRIQRIVDDYVRRENAEGARQTVTQEHGHGAAGNTSFSYPALPEDTVVYLAMVQRALVNLDDEALVLELDRRRRSAAKTRQEGADDLGIVGDDGKITTTPGLVKSIWRLWYRGSISICDTP